MVSRAIFTATSDNNLRQRRSPIIRRVRGLVALTSYDFSTSLAWERSRLTRLVS